MALSEEQIHRLKAKLRGEAKEKFPGDKERQRRYIFGTLRRLGWKPKNK